MKLDGMEWSKIYTFDNSMAENILLKVELPKLDYSQSLVTILIIYSLSILIKMFRAVFFNQANCGWRFPASLLIILFFILSKNKEKNQHV